MTSALIIALLLSSNTPGIDNQTSEAPKTPPIVTDTAPAATDTPGTVVNAAPVKPSAVAEEPKEETVCRRETSVGSRFSRRVCTTVSVSKKIDGQNRDATNQAQEDAERNGINAWTPYEQPK